MKILVLNASPRKEKSNTMKVTRAFLQGVENAETEIVHLSDLNVHPCLGCLSCWGRTEGVCVLHNDDMDALGEKIMAADVIVESFPLYFFGVPGTLKVVTDRLLRMLCTYRGQMPNPGESFHGIRFPELQKKKLILISTCGYGQTDMIYDGVRAQYDCIAGHGHYITLFCPQGKTLSEPTLASRVEKHLHIFTEAGKELALTGTVSPETQKAVEKPMLPDRTFRMLLAEFWRREKED